MKYLFIYFLVLFSCTTEKKTRTKEKGNDNIFSKEKVRNKIELTDMSFHMAFDDGQIDDKIVFGEYVNDRFESARKSIFLDGISDYIKIGNHDSLNPKHQMSISIWYKPDSYRGNGNNAIVWKGFTVFENPYCQFLIGSIGNLYSQTPATFKFALSIDKKIQQISTKDSIWSPNNWYNITGTYDGHKIKLYVNGELLAQRVISGKLDVYNTPVLIGKSPFEEAYTSGSFDDFRVFNRALSFDEVKRLNSEH